ncbi:MAG TPA: phosphoribosyltransferase family protein [Anaeromyxobacteraceae bacterium]
MGDGFAVLRLGIPPEPQRHRAVEVREVSWAEFGELAGEMAERIGARFQPDAVLGVVNGGVYIGGAIATALKAEFIPLKLDRRAGVPLEPLPALAGRRVLAIDDVTVSGQTLARARAAAEKAGAAEVRTAALVMRPRGNRPDFHTMETDDLVVFGWDYQLQAPGGASGSDPGDVGV